MLLSLMAVPNSCGLLALRGLLAYLRANEGKLSALNNIFVLLSGGELKFGYFFSLLN